MLAVYAEVDMCLMTEHAVQTSQSTILNVTGSALTPEQEKLNNEAIQKFWSQLADDQREEEAHPSRVRDDPETMRRELQEAYRMAEQMKSDVADKQRLSDQMLRDAQEILTKTKDLPPQEEVRSTPKEFENEGMVV